MESESADKSVQFQRLIVQLQGHLKLLWLQINSLEKTLAENNSEIQLLNDCISRLDASFNLADFQATKPRCRRKVTEAELEATLKSKCSESLRDQLAFLANHVRKLKAGVDEYTDTTIRQTSTLNAQRTTIARIQFQQDSNKRITVLEDIQILSPIPDTVLEDIQILPPIPDTHCSDPVPNLSNDEQQRKSTTETINARNVDILKVNSTLVFMEQLLKAGDVRSYEQFNIGSEGTLAELKQVEADQSKVLDDQLETLAALTTAAVTNNWNGLWLQGAGLTNVGNTCYMNCVLQVFLHIGPLVEWFLLNAHVIDNSAVKMPVTSAWLDLFKKSRLHKRVDTTTFVKTFRKKAPEFEENIPDDAVEFIGAFVKVIHTEMNGCLGRPFDAVFEFCQLVTVKCEECTYTSTSETWGSTVVVELNGKLAAGNLEAMLREHLHDKSIKKCYGCNKNPKIEQPCVIQKKFKQAPMFLKVLLMRFSQDQPKNSAKITIPQYIDIAVSKDIRYNLFAIINHDRYLDGSAHYTTIIRSPEGSWIEYDDSTVRTFDFMQLDKSLPFVVVYERMADISDERAEKQYEFIGPDGVDPNCSNADGRSDNNSDSDGDDDAGNADLESDDSDQEFDMSSLSSALESDDNANGLDRYWDHYKSMCSDKESDISSIASDDNVNDNGLNRYYDQYKSMYLLHNFEAMHVVENDSQQKFKRGSAIRATPTNVKRRTDSAGKLQEVNAEIPTTILGRKTPTKRSDMEPASVTKKDPIKPQQFIVPTLGVRLFTDAQLQKIKAWADEEKCGRHKMKHGGYDRILTNIQLEWNIKLTDKQLNNVLNRKYPANPAKLPTLQQMEFDAITRIKNNSPDLKWPEIAKLFNKSKNVLQRSGLALRQAYNYFKESTKSGKWDDTELKNLIDKYYQFGTCWLKYKIPGRSAESTRGRFYLLIKNILSKKDGKSFNSHVLEAIDTLQEDGTPTTRENLLYELLNTTNINSIHAVKFILNSSLHSLTLTGVLTNQNEEYKVIPKVERQKLERLKKKPKQPLRGPLNYEEKAHVQRQIQLCKNNSEKLKNLHWYGNDKLLKATTTTEGTREIQFEKGAGIFADAKMRHELDQLIRGHHDELEDDDNSDIIDMDEQFHDFHPRAFGVLRFKNSSKFLLFFTAKSNVCDYIHGQLQLLPSRVCCPSWLEAFVTDFQQIDYKRSQILATAEGYLAALRLKLSTVAMLNNANCYNVRRQTFCKITNHVKEYNQLLKKVEILPLRAN